MRCTSMWWLLGTSLLALAASAAAQPEPPAGQRQYVIPLLLPASHPTAEGFVRIINLSDQSGEVRIVAVDDGGRRFGPISFTLEANAAMHFNSGDLERGDAVKGLPHGVGDGTGNWRLEIDTALELEPLAFVRGADGFLTAMHGKAHQDQELAVFNPGSNLDQRSRLRLVNRAERETEVVIRGVDDAGESPGAEVRLTLAAGEARDVTAIELETGGEGIAGELGDGDGKWRLSVDADGPIWVMNLLQSPTGHLTNLTSDGRGGLTLPFFLSASDEHGRQGFARIRNRSDRAGTVHIRAFDDGGNAKPVVRLLLGAWETVHFNSQDLEAGDATKGLPVGIGPGQGDWRLLLDTDLAIEMTAYVRHADGFLTAMHDMAAVSGGGQHIPIFNPTSNDRQRSLLRLMNPSDEAVRVFIAGLDDAGASGAEEVSLDVPPQGVRTLTAAELESGGGAGLAGRLGDGTGKWRLTIEADGPLRAMSLMESPTGHLSNLSALGRRDEVTLAVSLFGDGAVTVAGLPDALECSTFECRGAFVAGSRLLLEASPAVTDFETEWNGCGRVDGNQCEVWLDAERLVLAAFQSPDPLALRSNVAVLSSAQLAGLARVEQATLHFAADTPGAAEWSLGDLLVSEGVVGLDEDDSRSLPFARRIMGIEGEYVLDTEPADLEDLLESGSFSSVRDGGPPARWEPPTPGAMVASGVQYVGTSPNRVAGVNEGHRFTVDRTVDGVRISGTLDMEITELMANLGLSPFRFRVFARPVLRAALSATLAAGASSSVEVGSFVQKLRRRVIQVRGLPLLTIEPEFVVRILVDATVRRRVAPRVTLEASAATGLQYLAGGGVKSLFGSTLKPTFSLGGRTPDYDAQVEMSLDGRLNMNVVPVFEAAGGAIHAAVTPYLGAARQGCGNYVDLYGGVRFAAGGEVSILSNERFSGDAPMVNRRLWREQVSGDKSWPRAMVPEMVRVPAGSFTMGASASEPESFPNERPRHRVSIPAFAAGAHEVTFAEWDACVADGGCGGYRPDDLGWARGHPPDGRGRGDRPVTRVSWQDAQRYVEWLSGCTGQRYRLLTESEWEYAARAGTTTPFHTGATITSRQANFDGRWGYPGAAPVDRLFRGRTVPVGSFAPNGFGLHDMHGNVWEWVQDCWNDGYVGAPTDGSAWEMGICSARVLRGGAWNDAPWLLRSAIRQTNPTDSRQNGDGFRVARTLDP